jgi:hypothetical protein
MNLLEECVSHSAYHFDPTRIDPRFDGVIGLGKFEGDWAKELQDAIAVSKPTTMANRAHSTVDGKSLTQQYFPPKGNVIEHYNQEKDFFNESTDFSYEKYEIINKTAELGPTIMKMVNAFKFAPEPFQYTCHIQFSGQVFPYHIDFFQRRTRFAPQDQTKLMRVMVMLTDWVPGHLIGYGNYIHQGWKAGDFNTLRHAHTPHYSANAAFTPRAMLLITGLRTPETDEFLWKASNTASIKI